MVRPRSLLDVLNEPYIKRCGPYQAWPVTGLAMSIVGPDWHGPLTVPSFAAFHPTVICQKSLASKKEKALDHECTPSKNARLKRERSS